MKKIAILSLSLTLAAAAQAQTAEFDYFKYAGNDARFNVEIDKTHQYYNPVLAGFYPDPSLFWVLRLEASTPLASSCQLPPSSA
jgi:xylan 1,4-beta-xylosidase